MYKKSVMAYIFVTLFLVSVDSSETLPFESINSLSKVSCMNFIYSVSKIHEMKMSQRKNDKIKIKPLFNNDKLSENIKKSFNLTSIKNKVENKTPSESLLNMIFTYNKVQEQIEFIDKKFIDSCESHFSKAFKKCQVLTKNNLLYEN